MNDRATRDPQPPLVPERIGRYEVLLPIASGGMATVYLARIRSLGGFEREVALKLTHAHLRESPEFAAELLEEAKLAVRIRHPNVVSTLDVGDDPYGIFLVMDYVEGDTLSGLSRRAAAAGAMLPPSHGLRILIDALAGLHAAHELRGDDGAPLGVVHRDFSPQNILVGLDGTSRLADFGIAKAESRLGNTRAGNVKGKISYMAPEQARSRNLDRRCDVWAAGVIAWELLTGVRMYADADDVTLLLKIVSEPPPAIRTVRPDVPQPLADAVARALTMAPEHRCPTAAAFARELFAACHASGLRLADVGEIGDLVNRLVGDKLAARRARESELVSTRGPMASLADAEPQHTPGPIPSAPLVITPLSTRVPDATRTDTTSVNTSSSARAIGAARWLGPRPLVAAAAIGAVLGTTSLFALWRLLRHDTAPAHAATSSASPPPADLAPPSSAPAPTSSAPPASAPVASATAAPPEAAPKVTLTANAIIAAVRVAGRRVAIDAPSKELTIELTSDEAGRATRLDLLGADGRRAGVTLEPGTTAATVTFPVLAGPAPLAPSPYRKRR